MVNDEARQGALRFALDEGGPFLATQEAAKIPPLIELPRLLSAAEHFADETDTSEDYCVCCWRLGRLWAARASTTLRQGWLSLHRQVSHKDDDLNNVMWEALALTLYGKRPVLPFPLGVLRRF